MRKVLALLVDRANYGRMKPVLEQLQNNDSIDLTIACTGTMLLEKYGNAAKLVKQDGFNIVSELFVEVDGNNFETTGLAVGLGVVQFTHELSRLQPDILLVIGDRYETLSAVIAAHFLKIHVAHIQGGEVSGTLDEGTRHVISKLSSLHFPATHRSADSLIRMGEPRKAVFNVGCPGGDILIRQKKIKPSDAEFNAMGVGADIDFNSKYLLVLMHPDTLSSTPFQEITKKLLDHFLNIKMQVIWLWPNSDAYAEAIAKAIRIYRENNDTSWLHVTKNLRPEMYASLLANASCAVGNSSSFVRDTCFTGTPVILVGKRQFGREVGSNVKFCSESLEKFGELLKSQIAHGFFEPSYIYGVGSSSEKINELITNFEFSDSKYLSYIEEESRN